MTTSTELGELARRHGLAKKRNNAIAAVIAGGVPAVILSHFVPFDANRWLIGVAVGLVWANGFEYAYHRWLLHRPRSSFAKGHLQHHANVGTPEEPEDVAFGKTPWHVFLLFASNGIVAILIDYAFGLRMIPGVFMGWVAYIVIAEEIHWRIHMTGWLPPGLRWARGYHMLHHDIPNARYNVFLPIFDLLLGSSRARARG